LETAKQVIRLQGVELSRLTKKILELTTRLAQLEGKENPEQLRIELAALQEQLKGRQHKVFGDSSERRPREKQAAEPKAKRGHGPREQPDLRQVDHFSELDEEDCSCARCGERLSPIAGVTEDSS